MPGGADIPQSLRGVFSVKGRFRNTDSRAESVSTPSFTSESYPVKAKCDAYCFLDCDALGVPSRYLILMSDSQVSYVPKPIELRYARTE